MGKAKFRCLYCGHLVKAREEYKRERQCSNCHRKGGIVPEETYQRGIKVAKSILKRRRPEVPFAQAVADILTILVDTFPNPYVPGKTLAQIVREAQRDIEMEKE